jgi:hypothetical protein
MEIRDVKIDDLHAIYKLCVSNDYFEEEVSYDNFSRTYKFLYFDTPIELKNIHHELVAVHNEKMVSHTAMVLFQFKVKNKIVKAGFGSNLIIDKTQRKGPLFFMLQSKYLNSYNKKGIHFTYGLVTRAQVISLHLRTGYRKVGLVPVYARPYNLISISKHYITSAFFEALFSPLLKLANIVLSINWFGNNDVKVHEITSFNESINEIVSLFLERVQFSALRNDKILNWRFSKFFHRNYKIFISLKDDKITGYAITRKMKMKGLISLALVDILFLPGDKKTAKALLGALHLQALKERVDLTSLIINPSSSILKYLVRFGFIKTSESFTVVVNEPRNKEFEFNEKNFCNWHITWFDHDFV